MSDMEYKGSNAFATLNLKPNVKTVAAPAVKVENAVVAPQKEILTDGKMRELFGDNFARITYYNLDANKWFGNGVSSFNERASKCGANNMRNIKTLMESDVVFRDLEMVAGVTMIVDDRLFPGWAETVRNPMSCVFGKSVLATLVCRDKRTGKILPVPVSWVGVNKFACSTTAESQGALFFTQNGVGSHQFRRALAHQHIKQK